ncbi:MAG: hypothetical protein EXR71_16210 [Myxococcales bacterium]|nr:hypothetical protein [Myxococcales bacterium]
MKWVLPAALVGLLAATAATWPAAQSWSTHSLVPLGYADVQAGLWWPRQVGDALLAGRNPFLATGCFWPEGQDVTLLVWNVLAELLIWPLWQLVPPHAALNLAAFVAAGVNAVAGAAAARRLGASPSGTLAAAALAGGSHFAFVEMVNGRIEQAFWAPVALFLAELVARDRRPIRAGVWLGIAAAVYWFYGYFLVLVTLTWLAVHRSRAAVEVVLRLGVTSLLVAGPFLAPVLWALADGSPRRAGEDTLRSQVAGSVPVPEGLFWPAGGLEPAFAAQAVPLLLVPVGVWGLTRGAGPCRWLGGIVLSAVLLSLGPTLVGAHGAALGAPVWLPQALLNVLPGMERFWWSYRWLTVAIPAFILVLTVGRVPRPLLALLVLGSLLETAALLRGGTLNRPLPRQGVRPLPEVAELRENPGELPVLVLPTGDVRAIHLGYTAWFDQPTNLGLGGHLPGVAPEGYGGGLGPEELGDFRYVLLFYRDARPGSRTPDAESGDLDRRLRARLGAPVAHNDIAAWWRVPE